MPARDLIQPSRDRKPPETDQVDTLSISAIRAGSTHKFYSLLAEFRTAFCIYELTVLISPLEIINDGNGFAALNASELKRPTAGAGS
jgi:hypothetical protein